jgi:hypothetical protein
VAEELGFKRITAANWTKPDEITLRFGPRQNSPDEQPHLLHILSPTLQQDVPLEIRKLFEVARGAMVYSYYFYPLYTLGMEQLFRIGEATLFCKCRRLGYRKKKPGFSDLINFLVRKAVFDSSTAKRWDALRFLRNSASHLDRQSIYSPGMAIGTLERLADDINALCPF